MGVDHPSGPGKGPETVDKPTTQGSGDKPPAENNGSSSETPRADSLRRAGWKLEGYGETGTDQRDDRDQRTGESSTTGSTGDKQRGPGAPPAETDPKADKEPQTGKTSGADGRDHPQGQPPGRETDGRAEPADRAASSAGQYRMPADNPGSTGQPSRLEDLARAREAQQQRAAQNAEGTGGGSGGQPGQSRDGGPTAPQEGNQADKAQLAGQTETDGTGRDAHAEGHGARAAAGGEGVRQDGHPPETPPADTRAASGGAPGGEVLGERDRPASQPSGEQGGGPAPEAGRPQDQEHPPLPHQDNAAAPADSGTPPGNEQDPPSADKQGTDGLGSDAQGTDGHGADEQGDGRARPEPSAETGDRTTGPAPTPPDNVHSAPEPSGRDAQPVQETGTNPQAPDGPADNGRTPPPEAPKPAEAGESGTEQPAEAATGTPDHGTAGDASSVPQEGESAQPGTETGETAPSGTAPDSGTDERGNTDDAPPPARETDQSAGAPEPPGEHDGDHGEKGQDDNSEQDPDETNRIKPEVPGNPIMSNVHTDSRGQVHVEPRYGREQTGESGTELTRNEQGTTGPQVGKVERDRSPYAMSLDEFTHADLDPTGTDVQPGVVAKAPDRRQRAETDPESRIERARQGTWKRGQDLKDAGTTLSDTVNGVLGPRPPTPTGHTETGTGPTMSAPGPQGATPDAFVAVATAAMLAVEGTRKVGQLGSRLTDRILGREHGSNR